MVKQIARLDRRSVSRRGLIAVLKQRREGYRRIAFPVGGTKTITTRDQQNHALVARGGMFAMDALIEHFRGNGTK